MFVEGLSEWVVRSPAEIYGLMERGGQVRATGETKMNEFSSRSHAVFIIIAEQSETVYVDDRGDEVRVQHSSVNVNVPYCYYSCFMECLCPIAVPRGVPALYARARSTPRAGHGEA